MILILSCDGDFSTDFVIQSLINLNYPYARINSWELLEPGFGISSEMGRTVIWSDYKRIETGNVGAVWHRKFGFFKSSPFFNQSKQIVEPGNQEYLSREFSSVLAAVISVFKKKNWLTNPENLNLNKIDALLEAENVGLSVPKSYILTERDTLEKLYDNSPIIVKSVRDSWLVNEKSTFTKDLFTMYTSKLSHLDIQSMPLTFFPSLVQAEIKKAYEIRVFCLLNELYAMAIFSQRDSQTEVDFRRYNTESPNRTTPYKLPTAIKKSIRKLINIFKLNCCSIDMIRGVDGRYYFLEINPTGQFGMVDFPCYYGLHEKVAKALIKLDKTHLNNEKISRNN